MGWLFYDSLHYKPNGEVDRKKECDGLFGERYTVLKSVMVGTVHYAAIRNNETSDVFAAITLTSADKKGGYNFGYKGMDEDCGPCETKCPKSILNLLTPTDSDFANSWRKRCREYHAQADELKKSPLLFRKIPVGTKVTWTVPHNRFSSFNEGEKVVLEKRRRSTKGKAFWLCSSRLVRLAPKYVNASDIELIA